MVAAGTANNAARSIGFESCREGRGAAFDLVTRSVMDIQPDVVHAGGILELKKIRRWLRRGTSRCAATTPTGLSPWRRASRRPPASPTWS